MAFQFQFPAGSFQKTDFPVSIPSRQFQKTASPVSIPSRQFQKRGNEGPNRGVCKGAWPSFTKKGPKVAVFVQFRRTFPRKKTLFDSCVSLLAQFPAGSFKKRLFQFQFPLGVAWGLRVLLPTEDGFPISIPSWQFPKTAFPVSIPSRQFQKTAFPVSIPSRQFQKTAFPVSIPSRQFQKRGNEGPKIGCLQGRLAIFHQKRAKSGSFCPVSSHVPTKKNVIRQLRFPACAIPSRQFQKNGFFSFNSHWALQFIEGFLPTRLVFPVSISGRQFQKTAFPVSIPSRQFQKTALLSFNSQRAVSKNGLLTFNPKQLFVVWQQGQ